MGRVVSLHRYPVKSMGGEDLDSAEITSRGFLGDRAYALVDTETGRVVSAKRPRRWSGILDCRARFVDPPSIEGPLPPVSIELPGGAPGPGPGRVDASPGRVESSGDRADLESKLSAKLGRSVRLESVPPAGATFEYHWPDLEGLEHKGRVYRDELTVHTMPPGTFFDGCTLSLLTTASLEKLSELVPSSVISHRRFRPNVVIESAGPEEGFVENDWVGRRVRIGRDVRVEISGPCLRCVMVTLAQSGLPADAAILKTVFAHNAGNLGVKAAVVGPGRVEVGDPVWLE